MVNNTASPTTGGGIYNSPSSSSPTIRNSILWGNSPDPMVGGAPVVTYSDVQGGWSGAGNINIDPQLTGAFRLKAGSPCIDAGSASNAPPTDRDGEARWDDPDHTNVISMVDMGEDEFVDMDMDDLADAWEIEYFGDLSRDGSGDADGDGATDLQEYEAGTDPVN